MCNDLKRHSLPGSPPGLGASFVEVADHHPKSQIRPSGCRPRTSWRASRPTMCPDSRPAWSPAVLQRFTKSYKGVRGTDAVHDHRHADPRVRGGASNEPAAAGNHFHRLGPRWRAPAAHCRSTDRGAEPRRGGPGGSTRTGDFGSRDNESREERRRMREVGPRARPSFREASIPPTPLFFLSLTNLDLTASRPPHTTPPASPRACR